MGAISQERLLKVILAPVISEKSTRIADKLNQVVFRVLPSATKQEIGAAVSSLFKVEVTGVQVLNVKGKVKRSGRVTGRRDNWKKAYVTLKQGQDIDFASGQ
ncbi:MAG: 50S ribosomal protein L23 [Thiobacillus sp.]|jgi:large subunit ribosomal protein L23|nr:50S ribosomal protein L23 [Gammaproteobacteria bacterium]OYZ27171.1 MAG: 50S ribosomal protein L23 [Hydrogenophilales bacterium 16-64-40]OZA32705.1 MAG: 50S ribosomal protein L23 [Hydrogenophilales bacterium 17-64-65]PKO70824.1 MAG: 50S ribosomal protein L23 [Betaproteobacteria bacterium HGW-Betaproteobacteria-17]HSJ80342.1 50S ribosomal protein L23 [Thiobacillus sp.]